MAGLAVFSRKPAASLVAWEVMPASSSLEGEALGALRAVTWLSSQTLNSGSTIWTDCRALVTSMQSASRIRGAGRRTLEELEHLLRVHGYRLEDRPRQDVEQAHQAARRILTVWKAGRRGEQTWNRGRILPATE
jgi:hypothetical protein